MEEPPAPETSPAPRRPSWQQLVGLFALAFLLLWLRSLEFAFPPDNDQAYYLNLAANLAAGEGLVDHTLWHTVRPPDVLPQPSNDYWMPLTAILIAPTQLAGPSYRAAMVPVVSWSALGAVLCAVFASRILGDRYLGLACGLFFVLHPSVQAFGGTSDSSVLYATLALAGCLLYERVVQRRGARQNLECVALGALVGLAALTRTDGAFVLSLTAGVAILASRKLGAAAPTLRQWGWIALGLLAVVLPWCLRSLSVFGTLWNPASGKVLFLTRYAQLFSWDDPPRAASCWAALQADPGAVLGGKGVALLSLPVRFVGLLHLALSPLVVVGYALLVRGKRPAAILACAFVASFCVGVGLLTNVTEIVHPRSFTAFVPLALVCAVAAARAGVHRLLGEAHHERMGKLTAGLALLAVVGLSGIAFVGSSQDPSNAIEQVGYRSIDSALVRIGVPRDQPVMTLQPMQMRYATGRVAVVAPEGGEGQALALAQRYDARLLFLNGYFLDEPGYAFLGRIYRGEAESPAFQPVYDDNGWKLFLLRWEAAPR